MITAQQAREICENKPPTTIDELVASIKTRAENGYDFIWLTDKNIQKDDLKTLIDLGYKVITDDTKSFKISW